MNFCCSLSVCGSYELRSPCIGGKPSLPLPIRLYPMEPWRECCEFFKLLNLLEPEVALPRCCFLLKAIPYPLIRDAVDEFDTNIL